MYFFMQLKSQASEVQKTWNMFLKHPMMHLMKMMMKEQSLNIDSFYLFKLEFFLFFSSLSLHNSHNCIYDTFVLASLLF